MNNNLHQTQEHSSNQTPPTHARARLYFIGAVLIVLIASLLFLLKKDGTEKYPAVTGKPQQSVRVVDATVFVREAAVLSGRLQNDSDVPITLAHVTVVCGEDKREFVAAQGTDSDRFAPVEVPVGESLLFSKSLGVITNPTECTVDVTRWGKYGVKN